MHNKYKQPITHTTPFKAKYTSFSTNPEEEWIRSESLFSSVKEINTNGSQNKNGMKNWVKVGDKSAEELMQDMLRGGNHKVNNPYYSKDCQERLAGILTNQYKRNTYINSLQADIPKLPPTAANNYQLLVLLLSQVGKNEIQVKDNEGELRIAFNQKVLDNQEMVLERLSKEKQAREEENSRVVKQYEEIIADLQKITQKLVGTPQQLQNSSKP